MLLILIVNPFSRILFNLLFREGTFLKSDSSNIFADCYLNICMFSSSYFFPTAGESSFQPCIQVCVYIRMDGEEKLRFPLFVCSKSWNVKSQGSREKQN